MRLRAFGRGQAKFVAPTSRPVSNNEPSGAACCRPYSLGQPQGSPGGVAVVGSNWLSYGGSPIGSGQDCSRFEPDAPVPAVRGTAAEPLGQLDSAVRCVVLKGAYRQNSGRQAGLA